MTGNKFRIIFTLSLLLVFTAGFTECGLVKWIRGGDKIVRDNPLSKFQVELPKFPLANGYTTPKGVLVDAQDPIPSSMQGEVLGRIDAGITKLFETTGKFGFTQKRGYADYYVILIRGMAKSQVTGCELLKTKAGQTIAGTVLSLGTLTIEPPFLLLPQNYEARTECQQQTENAARFEGEHETAWANQRDYFWQRTGSNDFHPMYPDETGNLAQGSTQHPTPPEYNCALSDERSEPEIIVNVDELIKRRQARATK